MALIVPFGQLVSFGDITFAGPSTPLQSYSLEWLTSFDALVGSPYPIDLYGVGSAPWKDPAATWVYLILATAGLSGAAAYANVQAQFSAIVQTIQAAYTYGGTYLTGTPTISGQVGDLTVKDGGGTDRTAFARISKLDLELQPGVNTYHYQLPLTWEILTDFT